MKIGFADTFTKSIEKMIRQQTWWYKTYEFFRYDISRFIRNVWRFRKGLSRHYWWDHHGMLMFMEAALTDMSDRLEKDGLEIDISRLKKVEKMRRAIQLIKNYNQDLYIEMAEKELGKFVDSWKKDNESKEKKGKNPYNPGKPPSPDFNGYNKRKEKKESEVEEGDYHNERSEKALQKSKEDFPQLKNVKKCDECEKVESKCKCKKVDVKEVKNWVKGLVENKEFHSFTSKNEIMELIQSKLNESETMTHQFGPKVKKGHNGIPEFMSYDAIVSAEPKTAPSKPAPKVVVANTGSGRDGSFGAGTSGKGRPSDDVNAANPGSGSRAKWSILGIFPVPFT